MLSFTDKSGRQVSVVYNTLKRKDNSFERKNFSKIIMNHTYTVNNSSLSFNIVIHYYIRMNHWHKIAIEVPIGKAPNSYKELIKFYSSQVNTDPFFQALNGIEFNLLGEPSVVAITFAHEYNYLRNFIFKNTFWLEDYMEKSVL